MIRSFITIFALTLMLTACSTTTTSDPVSNSVSNPSTATQHENKQITKTIWISAYAEKSKKPQPELITIISKEQDVNKVLKGIDNGAPVKLDEKNIERLFLLNLISEKGKKTIDSKYFLYAISKKGNLFIKEIKFTPDFDLDEFKATMIPKILNLAGQDNWVELQKDTVKDTNFPT